MTVGQRLMAGSHGSKAPTANVKTKAGTQAVSSKRGNDTAATENKSRGPAKGTTGIDIFIAEIMAILEIISVSPSYNTEPNLH